MVGWISTRRDSGVLGSVCLLSQMPPVLNVWLTLGLHWRQPGLGLLAHPGPELISLSADTRPQAGDLDFRGPFHKPSWEVAAMAADPSRMLVAGNMPAESCA